MISKEEKRLLENKLVEFNLIRESAVGIQSGIISGLIVIIGYGIYTSLLESEINVGIAFIIGSLVFYTFYYFVVKRPLNKIHKEIKTLCKKRK